jgi:hypothetical protein
MRRSILFAMGFIALTTASPSLASIPAEDGTYYGCYVAANGSLRVIDDSDPANQCIDGLELSVNWNQKGQQGDSGGEGPMGPQGYSASVSALDSLGCAIKSASSTRVAPRSEMSPRCATGKTDAMDCPGLKDLAGLRAVKEFRDRRGTKATGWPRPSTACKWAY